MAVVSPCREMYRLIPLTGTILTFCRFRIKENLEDMIPKVIILRERTSSQYGLDILGYTHATMVTTMRGKGANLSKTGKVIVVRIILCNSRI
jgi:hypothetical protein